MRRNYEAIRARVRAAWLHAREKATEEPTLIAVSKTHPWEKIAALYELGHRDFGESYVQELTRKAELLTTQGYTGIRWHFIGHLQTNKVKQLLPFVHAIHTVDSNKLALEIAKRARTADLPWIPVFIEVNIDQEESKSGIGPGELPELLKSLAGLSELSLQGLMCIPAPGSPESLRKAFEALHLLARQAGHWPHGVKLSMGMSDDFETAIDQGATHIRVGTAIFGSRE